jgi:uncharacterized membrane protein
LKRSVSEILRRGFESMLANWPLLLLRIAESIVMIIVTLVAIVAVIVPIVMSFTGGESFPQGDPNDLATFFVTVIAGHLAMILYILLLIMIVATVWICVHSFVEAGSARVYIDSMQRNAAAAAPTRNELNAFTLPRWAEGGKDGWWAVFWIYNIAWAIAFVILIIPIVLFGGLTILFRESGPMAAVTGCLGVFVLLVVMLPVGVVTAICTQKAIVNVFAKGTGASDSLRLAWRELRSDFGRHLAVAAVAFVVTIGLAIVVSSFSMMAQFGHSSPSIMMIPLQFSSSIINSIFGAAIGAWFLACFAALAVEPS